MFQLKPMSQLKGIDHTDLTPLERGPGSRSADVLGVLAVSTLLGAIGLATFFVTTSFAG